jgi:hypothetical protein
MIYLIQVKYDCCTLLKIGYTNESSKKNRFAAYKMHNPLSEVLFTIPEGTERHEKALHFMFRKYLYKNYGNEWFNYNSEIIEFFSTHTTKESLDRDLTVKPKVHERDLSKLHKEINRVVNRWLCLDSTDINRLNYNYSRIDKIIKDCRKAIRKDILQESDILVYLVEKYNISEDLQKEINKDIDDLNSIGNIKKFITNFNNLKDFPAKMKYLCTYPLTEQERGVVLDQIPIMYKNYYETLGPERCRANGYMKLDIEREYSDLQFDKNVLASEIRNTFEVGEKYTKNYIKETLKKIYTDLGYNKTPKANDLEQYFEIKLCKVTIETGKQDNGFKIVSIRYQEKVDLDD